MGTGPVSTDIYWEPSFYERELRAIFCQTWLCLGREEEIPEPGIVELRDAVMEDVNTLERIQNAISQGLCNEFVFNDHELTLRYQHYSVVKWVEDFEKGRTASR